MDKLRKKIDKIDSRIIELLAKRLEFSRKIGKQKQKASRKIKDGKREKEILTALEKLSEKHALRPVFIKKLYVEVLKESRKIQSNEK